MTAIAPCERRVGAHHHGEALRREALAMVAAQTRAVDVARLLRVPLNTVYSWVHEAKRAELRATEAAAPGSELEAAAVRVQTLIDGAGLEPAARRALQAAVTELVVQAMRRG